jgi:hypothetical protein
VERHPLVDEFADLITPTDTLLDVQKVTLCNNGTKQAILVILEKRPPEFMHLADEYKGMPVLWKVVGDFNAL